MTNFIRTSRGIGLDVVVITSHAIHRTMSRWGLSEAAALDRLTSCLQHGSIRGRSGKDTLVRHGDAVAVVEERKVVTVLREE